MILRGKPLQKLEAALRATIYERNAILDVGTPQRFHKELRPFEPLFAGKAYVAAGYQPLTCFGRYNADCHQDIERMSFAADSFDAVLCLEVLEHVRNPVAAVAEIRRVLRPGGAVLITTPFLYGYHGKGSTSQSHESYPDYWRFTHEGLALLLSEFADVRVCWLHGPLEGRLLSLRLAMLVNLPGVRSLVDLLEKRDGVGGAMRLMVQASKPR